MPSRTSGNYSAVNFGLGSTSTNCEPESQGLGAPIETTGNHFFEGCSTSRISTRTPKYFLAGQAECAEDLVEINPAGIRVIIAQRKLHFFARHRQPLDQPDATINARQTAPAIFQATGDDFK